MTPKIRPGRGPKTPNNEDFSVNPVATVGVLTHDARFLQKLLDESPDSHLKIVHLCDPELQGLAVDALIVDGRTQLPAWKALLLELSQPLPILIASPPGNWEERCWVAELERAQVFPPEQSDLVEQALQALERQQAAPRMTLLSDDAGLTQKFCQHLGPRLTHYSTVDAFWASLEEEVPDIILLDLQLGKASRLLGKALRQDFRTYRCTLFALQDPDTPAAGLVYFDALLSSQKAPGLLEAQILTRFRRGQAIRRLIDHDPMTGLLNRRRAKARLAYLLRLANRQRVPLSLAVFDLDHFKAVNDTYGHAAGDRVLKRLARLLRHSFRTEDVASRIGGEEFLVAMYGATAEVLGARLVALLETFSNKSFRLTGRTPFRVTFSAGVVQAGPELGDFQALYEAADRVLYQAKEEGRNRVLVG